MTHEFVEIIQDYLKAKQNGIKTVLATVVALNGSSYRKPGVRMLIKQNGQITGAVSGGCVEKEIIKQSDSVFKTQKAKLIYYDGRYRLGCEGIISILIEVFDPDSQMIKALFNEIELRNSITIRSYFSEIEPVSQMGSVIRFANGKGYSFYEENDCNSWNDSTLTRFSQTLNPIFRLVIIGAEHDAETLCQTASNLGWEVIVVVSPSNPKTAKKFPGISKLLKINAEELAVVSLDAHTAVLFMTHNYARDLQFLMALYKAKNKPVYCGLLGNNLRRERLLNELIERVEDIDDRFFELLYGPTGLNIGAVTPQEIALSICAEILSVSRLKEPQPLIEKKENINISLSQDESVG